MVSSETLFLLIKSLTKSEKRSFSIQTALHKQDTNYVRLFDFINSLREYDEKKIKEHFRNERFIVNFSVTKNLLYNLILKQLSSLHQKKNLNIYHREQLNHVEVLYEKGLYAPAKKILQTLKKDAIRQERFSLQLSISSWEQLMIHNEVGSKAAIGKVDHLIREGETIYAKQKNEQEYQALYLRMFYFVYYEGFLGYHHPSSRKKIQVLMRHPLLRNSKYALSVEAKFLFCFIHLDYWFFQQNAKKSYEWAQKIDAILKQKTALKLNVPVRNMADILYEKITASLKHKKHKEVFTLLEELKRCATHALPHMKAYIFVKAIVSETDLLNQLKEYEKITVQEEEIAQQLNIYKRAISPLYQALISVNVAIACFAAREYKKSLKWLNKVINLPAGIRRDILVFSRILLALIHYELRNSDALEFHIRAAGRFIKKQQVPFKTGSSILGCLKKCIKEDNPDKIRKHFRTLTKELRAHSKQPTEKWAFDEFDFTAWAAHKGKE